MGMNAEVKVFIQKNQKKDFEEPPTKKDLRELFSGTMFVGFHIPSEFSDKLTESIKEKQERIYGKKLWLAVLLYDNDALLRQEPLIIDSSENAVYEIGWSMARMIRTREAVDGAALFNIRASDV